MKAPRQIPKRPALDQAPLRSLRELAFLLGAERDDLRRLASDQHKHYSPFLLTKAAKPHTRLTPTAKPRQIDNPSTELKLLQTKILKRLLGPVTLPDFLYGAVRKRSIQAHAKVHLTSGPATLVKMDIERYFPTVTSRQVYMVWTGVLRCSPRVGSLLTKLTTFQERLPQGAPTSPALANLFLASVLNPVLTTCSQSGVMATSWVDDLTFSGQSAREIMEPVRRTLAKHGLRDSRSKRQVCGLRHTKEVTGVRLGRHGLRACKAKLRDVRAGIHHLGQKHFSERGMDKDIQGLAGKIAHIASICPSDARPLHSQFVHVLAQLDVPLPTCLQSLTSSERCKRNDNR